jgi:hypothetical protein
MPLTATGRKILRAMTKTYGSEKARRVFYAMEREGTLTPKAIRRSSRKRYGRRTR